MSHVKCFKMLVMLALVAATGSVKAGAQEVKTVFVIAMENHNWRQPANQFTGNTSRFFTISTLPSLTASYGTAFALVDGKVINISKQVAYATNYHNVLATPLGNNPHIHPSEPNYAWAEGEVSARFPF